jgi:hypothetical protein
VSRRPRNRSGHIKPRRHAPDIAWTSEIAVVVPKSCHELSPVRALASLHNATVMSVLASLLTRFISTNSDISETAAQSLHATAGRIQGGERNASSRVSNVPLIAQVLASFRMFLHFWNLICSQPKTSKTAVFMGFLCGAAGED